MNTEQARQREYWNSLANGNPDAAVIDPKDRRGIKNRYLAWLRDCAFERSLAGLPKHKCLLDFGCGTGSATQSLLNMGYQVVGVDIASRLLHQARRRLIGTDASFVLYDGLALPFAANSFAATTIYVVMSCVVDDELAKLLLSSIRGTMVPGGTIIMIEHMKRRRTLVQGGLKVLRTKADWYALLEGAGFEDIRSKILRNGHFPSTRMIQLGLIPRMLWPTVASVERYVGRVIGPLPFDYAEIMLEATA